MHLDEYLYFARRAFSGMTAALEELGDELANTPPALPGANSPYAIVHHCTAVADYWIGHAIAGRAVERDRPSEFTRTGSVTDLKARIDSLFVRLAADLRGVAPGAAPRNTPPRSFQGPERDLTAAGIQLHVLEELAQHHGQVEMTRDFLLARGTR